VMPSSYLHSHGVPTGLVETAAPGSPSAVQNVAPASSVLNLLFVSFWGGYRCAGGPYADRGPLVQVSPSRVRISRRHAVRRGVLRAHVDDELARH